MKYLVCFVLALTLLWGGEAYAKKHEWKATMPNYEVEVSGPLEAIPSDLRMNNLANVRKIGEKLLNGGLTAEDRYGVFANAGYRLFQMMRDTQASYYWYRVELWPNGESVQYDGLLGGITFTNEDGTEISPLAVLTTPVTQEATMENRGGEAPLITLYAQGTPSIPVRYVDFSSVTNDRVKWIAFLKLPRTFNPNEVTVTFPG